MVPSKKVNVILYYTILSIICYLQIQSNKLLVKHDYLYLFKLFNRFWVNPNYAIEKATYIKNVSLKNNSVKDFMTKGLLI